MLQIDVKITNGIELTVRGVYTEGTPSVLYPVDEATIGTDPSFEIHNIELKSGELYDLIEVIDCKTQYEFLEILEQTCIEQIEKNDE